jgi:hypothetical protein
MKSIRRSLLVAFCFLGVMLSMCAPPAFSQQVFELSYAAPSWTWTAADLSSLTGSSGAAYNSGMTGFVTTPNNQAHVFYQDGSEDIHQLYNNGVNWSDENLTTSINGAAALSTGSGISGFSIGNFQYVYFVASNQHVHEYSYVNSWVDTDLTSATDGALAAATLRMASFATSPNNQRHVYFVATDSTIHQLYFNGTGWADQNLTNSTNGAKAEAFATSIAGCGVGNHQYVFFVSNTYHLHMYSYVSSWTDTDWTARSGITGYGSVTGFTTSGTTKFQMYFNADDSNFDLYQLSYDDANPNNWATTDLSTATGAGGWLSQSVGFATTPNDQLHFFDIIGYSVAQHYFNGSFWLLEYLPGDTADFSSEMTGFSVGNAQYVFYVYEPQIG